MHIPNYCMLIDWLVDDLLVCILVHSYRLCHKGSPVHMYCQVEAQLKAHQKNVRALDYNPESNTMVTCSFDKTVKLFTAP